MFRGIRIILFSHQIKTTLTTASVAFEMTSCTRYDVRRVIFDDVWEVIDEILWCSLQGVLKTLHDVFTPVPESPVLYALVLDTVSVRDIPTGKCQVGLNLVIKFR